MPKHLLSLTHQKQQGDGDCLAACASIVLSFLGLSIDYDTLLQRLRVKAHGAPAGNIRLLAAFNLNVSYSSTDMNGLEALLQQGQPVIVFVRTGELPYWNYSTDHALVVAGFDETHVFVHDPYFEHTPISVSKGDFELAWLEHDYHYAVISS